MWNCGCHSTPWSCHLMRTPPNCCFPHWPNFSWQGSVARWWSKYQGSLTQRDTIWSPGVCQREAFMVKTPEARTNWLREILVLADCQQLKRNLDFWKRSKNPSICSSLRLDTYSLPTKIGLGAIIWTEKVRRKMHELILTMLEFQVVCPVTSQPSFIVCICHDRAISCSAITSGQIQSEEEIGPSLSLTHSSFQISDPRQDKRLITAGTCPILPRWLPHPLRENTLCVPSACLGNLTNFAHGPFVARACFSIYLAYFLIPLPGFSWLHENIQIMPRNYQTQLYYMLGPNKSGCRDKSFWSTLLSAEV